MLSFFHFTVRRQVQASLRVWEKNHKNSIYINLEIISLKKMSLEAISLLRIFLETTSTISEKTQKLFAVVQIS